MLWHFLRVIFVIALVLLGLEHSLMFLFDCTANGTIGLLGAALAPSALVEEAAGPNQPWQAGGY